MTYLAYPGGYSFRSIRVTTSSSAENEATLSILLRPNDAFATLLQHNPRGDSLLFPLEIGRRVAADCEVHSPMILSRITDTGKRPQREPVSASSTQRLSLAQDTSYIWRPLPQLLY